MIIIELKNGVVTTTLFDPPPPRSARTKSETQVSARARNMSSAIWKQSTDFYAYDVHTVVAAAVYKLL